VFDLLARNGVDPAVLQAPHGRLRVSGRTTPLSQSGRLDDDQRAPAAGALVAMAAHHPVKPLRSAARRTVAYTRVKPRVVEVHVNCVRRRPMSHACRFVASAAT
jgi:hypothetical protein